MTAKDLRENYPMVAREVSGEAVAAERTRAKVEHDAALLKAVRTGAEQFVAKLRDLVVKAEGLGMSIHLDEKTLAAIADSDSVGDALIAIRSTQSLADRVSAALRFEREGQAIGMKLRG